LYRPQEDVDEYLTTQGSTVEEVLAKLQEQYRSGLVCHAAHAAVDAHMRPHSNFKLWETKLLSSRKSLQTKMPEIRRALDAVIFLEKKQVVGCHGM
jgi:hypothetical protein